MCQLSTPFHGLSVIPRRCVGGRLTAFSPSIYASLKRYTQLHKKSISSCTKDILKIYSFFSPRPHTHVYSDYTRMSSPTNSACVVGIILRERLPMNKSLQMHFGTILLSDMSLVPNKQNVYRSRDTNSLFLDIWPYQRMWLNPHNLVNHYTKVYHTF